MDKKLYEDRRKEIYVTYFIARMKDYQRKWQEHTERMDD
jgi:hypothetical protein